MSGAPSISTRRAYGVQRICRVWERARSSVYARRHATRARAPRCRRGPVGAAPDAVLVGHIRRVLQTSPFHGEGDRKAWAKLRVPSLGAARSSAARPTGRPRRGDRRPPDQVGEKQDALLDLGREAEQAHDLGHPGAGDPFPTGDGRLAGGPPRIRGGPATR